MTILDAINVSGFIQLFPQSVSVKENHATSSICWTLTLVLLYVNSIVGGQQSRSKMCFVSCLKPRGPEPHKLPYIIPWIEKNKSICF